MRPQQQAWAHAGGGQPGLRSKDSAVANNCGAAGVCQADGASCAVKLKLRIAAHPGVAGQGRRAEDRVVVLAGALRNGRSRIS